MKAFNLHLQSATQYERMTDVTSFVGQDATGSFAIWPNHQRMMTSLTFGLARFRTFASDDTWQYLALPGALLYFLHNQLFISTRKFVRDVDFTRISQVLDQQLRSEESSLQDVKETVHRLEEEMFKRLWKMGLGEDAVR